MHARELVELAAVVVEQAQALLRGSTPLSRTGLEQYWTASKCRLDRWGRTLKRVALADGQPAPPQTRGCWPQVRGTIEEILTGEILARVWTAVVCDCDHRQGTDEAEPLARSVLLGHMEAKHRVLSWLVHRPAIDVAEGVRANLLRRRCERWTDLLLGGLAGLCDVRPFAVDPPRAIEFAADLRCRRGVPGGRKVWALLLASLRSTFRHGLAAVSPNADLNASIASSILACFQSELFDSTGLFRSLWLLRLVNVTEDAQGMVEQLLASEAPAGGDSAGR